MKYNTKSITITVPTVSKERGIQGQLVCDQEATKVKAEALAVLVGGEYNLYARHTDVDQVHALQAEYEAILARMESLLTNN